YETRLWSLFGQYTQKVGDLDLLLGLRQDNHDEYRDHLSYNAGVVWTPHSQWILKTLYGTAYRTPFARQLLGDGNPELEKIKTLNLQVLWKPSERAGLSLCGFSSKIHNHIMEDPYAGLSMPNEQRIYGMEFESHLSIGRDLDLAANLTLQNNSGPDETYRYEKYKIPEPQYEYLHYPYDAGPGRLFSLSGLWRAQDNMVFSAVLKYASSTCLAYPRGENSVSLPGRWLLDIGFQKRDFIIQGIELGVSLRNVTNKHYKVPGTYGLFDGEPFTAQVMLSMPW
ncbi:MAG: TonB-dependent receptor, partial [Deltaproteobacteria bacterium]|nr:TonB-dependent receptor [Deltaproteobacteria bacterium]